MIAGGRTRRIFSQSTQQGPYLQEAYALAAIAIVPVVRSLQLEVGVTRRELCAALNDSLQVRLEPRSSSVCRRGFTVPFSFHPEGHSTVSRQGKRPNELGHLLLAPVWRIPVLFRLLSDVAITPILWHSRPDKQQQEVS